MKTIPEGLRISKEDFLRGLKEAGLKRGEVVYVASSMAALGFMEDPTGDVLWALREAVGPEGTLVMPTFNFAFSNGEPFDLEETPSRSGVLTEAFRQLPDAVRSWEPPVHTVTAVGPRAQEITERAALTSFGKDSVFQYLHDIGAKQLLIGCGYHEGAVHYHWLEELHEVPYRYWKKFEGDVLLHGVSQRRVFFMYVRRPGVTLNADPVGQAFEATGLVRKATVGLCTLRTFHLPDFCDFMSNRLTEDPHCLVASGRPVPPAPSPSPVKRIHHIAVVSRYSDHIVRFFETIGCRLASEGIVQELGVNCRYFDGLDVRIEFVDPIQEDSRVDAHRKQHATAPLHHIAFEVDDMEEALTFFEGRGYVRMDEKHFFGPEPYERVLFLSPLQTGGLLVELVASDGVNFDEYSNQT